MTGHFGGPDHTPNEAREKWCCASTGFDKCEADKCMAWRWTPLSTRDPRWQEAMRTLIADGMTNANAAKALQADETRKRFGLPLAPERGYCGRAGVPE